MAYFVSPPSPFVLVLLFSLFTLFLECWREAGLGTQYAAVHHRVSPCKQPNWFKRISIVRSPSRQWNNRGTYVSPYFFLPTHVYLEHAITKGHAKSRNYVSNRERNETRIASNFRMMVAAFRSLYTTYRRQCMGIVYTLSEPCSFYTNIQRRHKSCATTVWPVCGLVASLWLDVFIYGVVSSEIGCPCSIRLSAIGAHVIIFWGFHRCRRI